MSLPRKDVRLKITPEAHRALTEAAEFLEKDISEVGAQLFEKAVIGEVHVLRLQAERIVRWGNGGKASGMAGESEGAPAKPGFTIAGSRRR